jgi:hypothetical protein
MERSDATGKRGEAIFVQSIMDFCGRVSPYFNPIFLGEKNESLDFLVEVDCDGAERPFFFVQVKATKAGYTTGPTGPRLKVKLSKESVETIRNRPAPTYLVGVDEPASRCFIVAIHEKVRTGIPSMPTAYPLDCENLKKLWDEVRGYWQGRDSRIQDSVFSM